MIKLEFQFNHYLVLELKIFILDFLKFFTF
jgi:hypothetical protein